MGKPPAPAVRVRRWAAGSWSESPDAVVTEEPLQLMLDGTPLSVVMRTPGEDIELCLGLMFAEGIVRSRHDVRVVRISAEAQEKESGVEVDAALVVCDDPLAHLSITAKQRFSKLPTIALDWQETATMAAARVSIPLATIGVESGGTIFRADGVPLALRPAITAPLPADHEALRSLRTALGLS